MNLNSTCLLGIEYFCVNSFCICYCDLFFSSDQIAVWHGFLILDNFICADRDILKNSYAVFVSGCWNVYISVCVWCASQVELDVRYILLTLSPFLNLDRACFLDVLKSDFCCFVVFNCYFLLISSEVSRRNCWAVLCDDILADNKLIEHCYAIFICCRFKLQVLVCIRNACCKELNALDIEISCGGLCDLNRTTFLLVCHFSLDDIIVFCYFERIRSIVNFIDIRCWNLTIEILAYGELKMCNAVLVCSSCDDLFFIFIKNFKGAIRDKLTCWNVSLCYLKRNSVLLVFKIYNELSLLFNKLDSLCWLIRNRIALWCFNFCHCVAVAFVDSLCCFSYAVCACGYGVDNCSFRIYTIAIANEYILGCCHFKLCACKVSSCFSVTLVNFYLALVRSRSLVDELRFSRLVSGNSDSFLRWYHVAVCRGYFSPLIISLWQTCYINITLAVWRKVCSLWSKVSEAVASVLAACFYKLIAVAVLVCQLELDGFVHISCGCLSVAEVICECFVDVSWACWRWYFQISLNRVFVLIAGNHHFLNVWAARKDKRWTLVYVFNILALCLCERENNVFQIFLIVCCDSHIWAWTCNSHWVRLWNWELWKAVKLELCCPLACLDIIFCRICCVLSNHIMLLRSTLRNIIVWKHFGFHFLVALDQLLMMSRSIIAIVVITVEKLCFIAWKPCCAFIKKTCRNRLWHNTWRTQFDVLGIAVLSFSLVTVNTEFFYLILHIIRNMTFFHVIIKCLLLWNCSAIMQLIKVNAVSVVVIRCCEIRHFWCKVSSEVSVIVFPCFNIIAIWQTWATEIIAPCWQPLLSGLVFVGERTGCYALCKSRQAEQKCKCNTAQTFEKTFLFHLFSS